MTDLEEQIPGIAEALFQYRDILSAINQARTPCSQFFELENAEKAIAEIVERTAVG